MISLQWLVQRSLVYHLTPESKETVFRLSSSQPEGKESAAQEGKVNAASLPRLPAPIDFKVITHFLHEVEKSGRECPNLLSRTAGV